MMRRATLLAVAAAFATVISLAITGAAGGAVGAVGARRVPSAPISASTTTPTGSSVLIAMGHLHQPLNTFWELFVRPAGASAWVLHTPPGVASNGGLVLAPSPSGQLTVGFLPSEDLKFSPVAQSVDGGAHWSPGELPLPLTAAPDALAVASTGDVLALVAAGGQRVLQAPGDLATWRTLTTTRALRGIASSCGVVGVSAVAYSPVARPLVGLDCSRRGQVGILMASGSVWHDIGLSLGSGSGTASVTRLVATTVGVDGLAQVQAGKQAAVVGFWSNGSTTPWVRSATLAVPAGWSVKATATGGGSGQGLAVLLGSGKRRRVEVVGGPGDSWVTLPPAPPGASGVSIVGAEVETFVVKNSDLAVWAWNDGAAGWSRTASITVPVPYGSSS